jgi:hypothetical protein
MYRKPWVAFAKSSQESRIYLVERNVDKMLVRVNLEKLLREVG